MAVIVAMYRTRRTGARPPVTMRRPRSVPLSRLNGATPTRAAILRRVSRPSSGRSAMRVNAVTGPIPGTERRRSSASRQPGLERIVSCIGIDLPEGAFEPADVDRNPPLQLGIAHEAATVCFGAEHFDQLATAGHEFAQDLGLRIRQRPGDGPDRFGKPSDDARIEGIRLGERTRRPGEIPDLPWVDHRNWEPSARQRGRHGDLISAGGFENHDRWRAGNQALSECNKAGRVVANAERLASRAEVDIKAILGDVNADKQGVFHDPSLRMRALMAQATVRAR